MHQQTAFNSLNIKFGDLSVAENLANEAFSLPMHPYFEYEEVLKISSVLSKV